MHRFRLRAWGAAVAGALVVCGGIAAWYRMTWGHHVEVDSAQEQDTDTDADQEPETDTAPEAAPEPTRKPVAPRMPSAAPPAPTVKRRSALSHTADPCRPVEIPDLPSDYPRITVQGVTVMWPTGEAPIAEPTAFAYLVAGLLEEAALLTGTARREQVTVVLYPSNEVFHALSGAPSWADGLYTGAVHLPVSPGNDFGVRLKTLRHELMHAQLHSATGCMPLWFNEGLAMRFGGRPPWRQWLRMLRERQSIDFESLEVSKIDEMGKPDVDLVYAQSLAMVLLLEERSPDDAIEEAVGDLVLRRGQPRSEALRLWGRLRPGVGQGDLLGSLARRVFGVPVGPGLERAFQQGALCCWGISRINGFGCRGAPVQPGKKFWIDESREPFARCEVE